MPPSDDRPGVGTQVEDVVEAFLAARRAGEPIDPADLILAHPALAAELEPRLAATAELLELAEAAARPGPSLPARVGRYEVRGLLGRGASSVVYRAFDPKFEREVALKVFRGPAGARSAERFHRDARLLARLRHSHIVPLHETGEDDGRAYIDMELVAGESLEDRLGRGAWPDSRGAAALARLVALALHHAHAAGVVHRDVKPSNVLIDHRGEPQLTDFGLARGLEGDPTLTADGQVLGTPAYMPPEQARGDAGRADARSDVYSLGVVLYRLLTRRLPFEGTDSPTALLRRVLDESPPPPRRVTPSVPRDLETICLKAVDKEPAHRFPTAEAFAEELRRWLDGERLTVRRTRAWERARKWARRHPSTAGAAGLILALTVATALLGWAAWNQRDRARLAEGQAALGREQAGLADARQTLEADARARAEAATLLGRARSRLRGPAVGRRFETQRLLRQVVELTGRVSSREAVDDLGGEARCLFAATLGLPDCRTVETLPLPELPPGLSWPVALHPDGNALAIGTDRGPVLWRRGRPLDPRPDRAPAGPQPQVAFSPDGRYLTWAPPGGGLQVWDGEVTRVLAEPQLDGPGIVLAAGFDEPVTTLWACLADGRVAGWSLPEGSPVAGGWVAEPPAVWTAACFAPNAASLAVGDAAGEVRLFDRAGRMTAELTDPDVRQRVLALAWSPDGRRVAVGIRGGGLKLWERDGRPVRRFTGSQNEVSRLDFTPDGLGLLAGGREPFRLWDVETAELLLWGGPDLPGTPSGFSRDGRRFATGYYNQAAFHELQHPTALQTLRGHAARVELVAWSGDGTRLASLDAHFGARVWDAASGAGLDSFLAPVGDFYAHNAAMALNRDGTRLAFASGGDARARALIRDVAAGRTLDEWPLPGGYESLAHDGERFLLVREEFEPGGETVRSVLRHLEVGRPPDVVSIVRPAGVGDRYRFLDAELTSDGRFYCWVGPRGPGSARRAEVWEVGTGRPVATVPLPTGEREVEPKAYLEPGAGALWTYTFAEQRRLDLRHTGGAARVDSFPRRVSADGWWRVFAGAEFRRPYSCGVFVGPGGAAIDLAGYDMTESLYAGKAIAFSPDGRFVAWGGESGHITVADLQAVLAEVLAFSQLRE